ncbi:hypothetical protein C0Q70_02108 [Pomacea canaliculata]|uniref:Ras-related protein Rab-37 n=1 Tax=Pomacea canaliculata TaxID=400727 RepID=A0A2T7Q1D4_POMCA|nr:hypothetical protein C0Q70_02108 [Pomacea canaliculata]
MLVTVGLVTLNTKCTVVAMLVTVLLVPQHQMLLFAALLLLYDVTNKTSFDNIRAWLAEINEYAQEDVVIMLLGNKCDASSERVIRKEEGERLAREYGVAFMETSAKTGVNVDLAFMAVARDLKMKKTRRPNEPKFCVADYVEQEKRQTGCCS